MDISTITKDKLRVRKEGSDVNSDPEEITLEDNLQTAIFKPLGGLEKTTKYEVTVTNEVKI